MAEPHGWRERILAELVSGIAPVTLAADPDGLLLDEELLEAICGRGFELLTFEDPVAFRLAHEVRFRHRRASGNVDGSEVELLLRFDNDDLAAVPYDLLQAGRPLRFGLSELFPDLSYAVLAALDTAALNAVDRAQKGRKPKALGENETKDFVLQYAFGIRPAEIRGTADLLHMLLRRHYSGIRTPHLLDERLLDVLQRNEAFASWPLEAIVPDREAFFAFLQERWPVFLDGGTREDEPHVHPAKARRRLSRAGPPDLPFDHADVRVYVDNLFLEGKLAPVPHAAGVDLPSDWVSVGIRCDPQADRLRRLEKLIEHVEGMVPQSDARHPDWLSFAWLWAELGFLWWATVAPARQELGARLANLRRRVDVAFLAWVESRYAGLHNQPPDPPVMVHHLPRYVSRRLEDAPERKIALVVVDGLALDQWLVLRDVLADQRPALGFRSNAIFAWAPTITSVSRQAIFAGRPPFYFEASIHTTEKEASLWSRFWAEHGLNEHEVAYLKGRDDSEVDELRQRISEPLLRAVGLVVNKVDEIMHGMELGASGMHNQVRQWAEEGYPATLVDTLLDSGFVVFLTSDHGNIEARGFGRPSEGALVGTRGKRARLYPDTTLRDRVLEQYPDAVAWPGSGLPDDCHALLAPGRAAFASAGERTVGHGGVSLEELVVPFIEIERQRQ